MNREKAREIRHACTACSPAKAAAHVGFEARIPLGEGVRETIDWYRAEGWL